MLRQEDRQKERQKERRKDIRIVSAILCFIMRKHKQGAVALAEKFSQATAPKIMLFGVRDASDRCHPAFSAPFVRTLTDILRCLTKCSIRWFDQAKIIRFFSEGKGVFPFSLTVSYGGVC